MPTIRGVFGGSVANPDMVLVEGDGDPPDFWWEDTDGNKIIQFNQDESVDNVSSFSTESARIGTVSGQGDAFRLIDRRTPGSNTSTIQFTGLSNDAEYKIFLNATVSGTPSSVFLRLNGDGASTGNYVYWDASGTKQSGENQFLLYTLSDLVGLASEIRLTSTVYGSDNRTGINHEPLPGGPPARITDYGDSGTRDTIDSLSSVELQTDGSFSGGNTVVELWERDYS